MNHLRSPVVFAAIDWLIDSGRAFRSFWTMSVAWFCSLFSGDLTWFPFVRFILSSPFLLPLGSFLCPYGCRADQQPIDLCTCASVSSSFFQSSWPLFVSIRLIRFLLIFSRFRIDRKSPFFRLILIKNWSFVLILAVRSPVRVNQIDVQFDRLSSISTLISKSISSCDFNQIFPFSPFVYKFCAHALLSRRLVFGGQSIFDMSESLIQRYLCGVCLYSIARHHWRRGGRRRRRRGRHFRSVARQSSTRVDAFFCFRHFRTRFVLFDRFSIKSIDWIGFSFKLTHFFVIAYFAILSSSVARLFFLSDQNRLFRPVFIFSLRHSSVILSSLVSLSSIRLFCRCLILLFPIYVCAFVFMRPVHCAWFESLSSRSIVFFAVFNLTFDLSFNPASHRCLTSRFFSFLAIQVCCCHLLDFNLLFFLFFGKKQNDFWWWPLIVSCHVIRWWCHRCWRQMSR